jgi:hypothetical protein
VQHKIASDDPMKSSLVKMSFQTLDFLAKADFADDWKIERPSIKEIENLEWFWRRRESKIHTGKQRNQTSCDDMEERSI